MSREIKFRHIKPDGSVEFEQLNREMSEGYIEQYTGLKDRNGKEIYEGDIVYLAGQGNVVMEFPFFDLYDAAAENDIGEIVGNIHENPELLDGDPIRK